MNKLIYLFSLFISLSLSACVSSIKKAPATYQTFIIWYDNTVGKDPLLKYAARENAEILYDYQNFNGMALRVPVHDNTEHTRHLWEQIPGVLAVEPDRVMQLH